MRFPHALCKLCVKCYHLAGRALQVRLHAVTTYNPKPHVSTRRKFSDVTGVSRDSPIPASFAGLRAQGWGKRRQRAVLVALRLQHVLNDGSGSAVVGHFKEHEQQRHMFGGEFEPLAV